MWQWEWNGSSRSIISLSGMFTYPSLAKCHLRPFLPGTDIFRNINQGHVQSVLGSMFRSYWTQESRASFRILSINGVPFPLCLTF